MNRIWIARSSKQHGSTANKVGVCVDDRQVDYDLRMTTNGNENEYLTTDHPIDVVIDRTDGSNARSGSLWVVPLLIGSFVVLLNVALITFGSASLPFRRLSWWLAGNVAAALILTSIFVGIFLIVYAFALGKNEAARRSDGRWFARWVLTPLVLGLVGAFVSVWSLKSLADTEPEKKPCLELYQQAQNIYKENPKFRMPLDADDQQRCRVNEAIAG